MEPPTGRRSSHVAPDVQHFIGYVETTTDALRLIMAARQGIIPRITRRLNDSERRSMIRSGAVFVFCVEESGIKRWTEGLSWSPSRIVGNFLMYREVGERNSTRGTDTALLPPGTSTFRVAPPGSPVTSYYHGRSDAGGVRDFSGTVRPSGLIKKTITVKVSGTDHHLVSYYREEDIARGLLQRPTSRPDIMALTIPPEMVRATNFRHPPHVDIGPDGNAHM
ncbi:Gti1/Pac2 family-domain-containing protein [Lactifluus volemus]|nr:Gti1/Pac2 family-domain-containing protein [Lactifluus volemus]